MVLVWLYPKSKYIGPTKNDLEWYSSCINLNPPCYWHWLIYSTTLKCSELKLSDNLRMTLQLYSAFACLNCSAFLTIEAIRLPLKCYKVSENLWKVVHWRMRKWVHLPKVHAFGKVYGLYRCIIVFNNNAARQRCKSH